MTVRVEKPRLEFEVREDCNVEIVLRCSEELRPGDTVEWQYPHCWALVSGPSHTREFQAEDPLAEHYVMAESEGAVFEVAITPRHLYYPEGIVRHGRHIVATLAEGTIPVENAIRLKYMNTYAPDIAETNSPWIRVKGQAPDQPVELVVHPGEADDMRVIAPSIVRPGETFDVLIVSLDRFQNCSATGYKDLSLAFVDGPVVEKGLNFIGSIRVPVTLNEEGVYRFQAGSSVSNAVKVSRDEPKLYWGDIHVHSELSHDGEGRDPYGYARHVSGLDFAALADHWPSLGEMGNLAAVEWANNAQEPGKFVTLLADERSPDEFTGHHNLYFRDEAAFTKYRDDPAKYEGSKRPALDLAGFSKSPPEVMLVPHHTGIMWGSLKEGSGMAINLDAAEDYGFRPIMEIVSHHGQSELYSPQHVLAYEFNRMRRPQRRANTSVPGPHYAQDYWMAGRRLGVIGSSDDHAGQPGERRAGLAAVRASELTRETIFDALFARQCYGTTGERILIEFSVDGAPMGSELTRKAGAKLPIRLRVWGTELLLRVDILRHRFGGEKKFELLLSDVPRPESRNAGYEIEDEVAGPCMYYARVIQEPLEWPDMAWSSPVWVNV